MNFTFDVEPSCFIPPERIINHIQLSIFSIDLFKSVTVVVSLCDDKDYVIDNKQIIIEGEEYNNWSNDDNYLINLVLVKLGLTKKTIVEPIDEAL